jgi:hypothetical protein
MDGSSFFRMETFGRRARTLQGKRSTPWRTIDGVVAEATRRLGGAPHVKGTTRVELIAGDDPAEIGALAVEQARRAVDWRGRRLREDGTAMVACVASYPVPAATLMSNLEEFERYEIWCDRTVAWVRDRWGHLPHAIVEHRDEARWHVHALIVPALDEHGRLQVGSVHPGIAARDTLQRKGAQTAAQNQAYRAAMSALLDDFHAVVGALVGHARRSEAPRRRLTREQAMAERRQREQATLLLERERELIVAEDGLHRTRTRLEAERAAINQAERGLAVEREALDRQRGQFEEKARAAGIAIATERRRLLEEQAAGRARLAQAADLVRAASARNVEEHDRLVAGRREAMASGPTRVAAENATLRAALAAAREQLATLEAERVKTRPALR